MEKEQKLLLSEKEKDGLIREAWDDKKARLPESGRLALYVALDSPKPNLAAITRLALDELSSPNAEDWARRWGRVVVCVKTGRELLCVLGDTNDSKNKSFIPLSTSAKISPQEVVESMPKGSLGTLVLNNKNTTIEAFLISYIHMIDELVWDLYRSKLEEAGLASSRELYNQTVIEVKQKGFSIKTAAEDEILLAKKNDPKASIRLYGSGVNKDVSRVMGAVIYPKSITETGDYYEDYFLYKLKGNENLVTVERNGSQPVEQKNLKPVILTSVTFGKELHAGHMLLLATADLLKNNLGSKDPVVLINNNTGPRPAGALVRLSQDLGLSLEEAATILNEGKVDPIKIVEAYRGRREGDKLAGQALTLLDQGRYDIFSAMVDRVVPKLEQAELAVEVVAESKGIPECQKLIDSVNPIWNGSGFTFLPSENGIKILQKGGRLTATGKCISSLRSIAEPYLGSGQAPLMIFVDSSLDALDSVSTYSSIPELGKGLLVPGTGIGIAGELASGSKGEALTLTEIIDQIDGKIPTGSLTMALKHLILNRPGVILDKKSISLETFYYDYKNNESYIRDLILCYQESLGFQASITQQILDSESKVGETTKAKDPKSQKDLVFISMRLKSLKEVAPEKVVRLMYNPRIVGIPGEYCKLEDGLSRFMPKYKARTLLLNSLMDGNNTASKIAEIAVAEGVNMPNPLFGNDFKFQNDILNAVIKQGYDGEYAIQKTLEYMNGQKGLVVRDNFYYKELRALLDLLKQTIEITPSDFAMLSEGILYSARRLGYEV